MNEQKTSQLEKELSSLIGLKSVKEEVQRLTNFIKVQQMRRQCGLMTTPISYHCVFTGNPGTGKTTVARILAGIFKGLGILSKGQLVETDRSGLVAEYVGQTAVKTNKVIDSAMDGVLFIDEAYSLAQGGQNDFGTEAISTLLKRMEDDRNRLIVILAGYGNEMKQFIDTNPGLQSRFNRYIEFSDYSVDELLEIYMKNVFKHDYSITENAKSKAKKVIEIAYAEKDKNFGNARFVRNLFEKTLENQAMRLVSDSNIDREQLILIKQSDLCSDNTQESTEDNSPIIACNKKVSIPSLEPYDPCLDLPNYKKPTLTEGNASKWNFIYKKQQSEPQLYNLLQSIEFQNSSAILPCIIGSNNTNECKVIDMSINNIFICHSNYEVALDETKTIILSLLCKMHPAEVKFLIIDTKCNDFSCFNKLQKHFLACEYLDEGNAISNTNCSRKIRSLILEIQKRKDLFRKANVNDIFNYNATFKRRMLLPKYGHEFLPYIIFVAYLDEINERDVSNISPIIAIGKQYGIFTLLLSDNKNKGLPLVNLCEKSDIIITNNEFFLGQLNSSYNNTYVLSHNGIEEELRTTNTNTGCINDIVKFISNQDGYWYAYELPDTDVSEQFNCTDSSSFDPLFEDAAKIIVSNQLGSTSLIQRKLTLGYKRAGEIMDQLEKTGIVGPPQGSKPRIVRIPTLQELNQVIKSILH